MVDYIVGRKFIYRLGYQAIGIRWWKKEHDRSFSN